MTSKPKKPSESEPGKKIKLVGLLNNPTQQDFEELARKLEEESKNTTLTAKRRAGTLVVRPNSRGPGIVAH